MMIIERKDGGNLMKPNTMLWIFLAVFVVAALLYLIAILMKRRNEERLDELEKRKIDLFDLPVIEEVEEVKKNAFSRSKSKHFS